VSKTLFTQAVIKVILSIPYGKVSTYGRVAAMAGNARAARQVARVLHTCSQGEELPWHRVVNREGRISLKKYHGYEEQKALLEKEGVLFSVEECIDLEEYLWVPNCSK